MTGDAPRPEPAGGIAMIGGGRMASALAGRSRRND